MTVSVLDDNFGLDPSRAVTLPMADLWSLAGASLPANSPLTEDTAYVPRIPIDAAEAKAMLSLTTILADATEPECHRGLFVGYTERELTLADNGACELLPINRKQIS